MSASNNFPLDRHCVYCLVLQSPPKGCAPTSSHWDVLYPGLHFQCAMAKTEYAGRDPCELVKRGLMWSRDVFVRDSFVTRWPDSELNAVFEFSYPCSLCPRARGRIPWSNGQHQMSTSTKNSEPIKEKSKVLRLGSGNLRQKESDCNWEKISKPCKALKKTSQILLKIAPFQVLSKKP